MTERKLDFSKVETRISMIPGDYSVLIYANGVEVGVLYEVAGYTKEGDCLVKNDPGPIANYGDADMQAALEQWDVWRKAERIKAKARMADAMWEEVENGPPPEPEIGPEPERVTPWERLMKWLDK